MFLMVAWLVESICYETEGRGFDSRQDLWGFHLTQSFQLYFGHESTQPLTEMSTRNLLGAKGKPVRKADNLTAICVSIVYKMWEPRRFTTLWASTACYRVSFTSSSS
jgi:hypothetical protein